MSVIGRLLPNKPRGVPRVDDRRVLNGFFWRLRMARPGRIFRGVTGRIRPASIVSTGGGARASGTGFCKRVQKLMMATFRRSIHRQSAVINTPPTVKKSAKIRSKYISNHGSLARRLTTKINALVDFSGLPVNLKIT